MAEFTKNLGLELPTINEFYSVEKINANTKKIADAIARPNLLDNTDFSNPINQRGQSTYTTEYGYTIDRWAVHGSASLNDGFIKFTSSTDIGYFLQRFEFPDKFANKTITVSVKYRTNYDHTYINFYTATTEGHWSYEHRIPSTNGEWKVESLTVTIPNRNYNRIDFGLDYGITFDKEDEWTPVQIVQSFAGETVDVAWMKMEYGDTPTVWQKPNYATELLKCQRYFEKVTFNDTVGVIVQKYSSNAFRGFYNYQVRKRTTPAITFEGVSSYNYGRVYSTSGGVYTPTSVSAVTKNEDACCINLSGANHSIAVAWVDYLKINISADL